MGTIIRHTFLDTNGIRMHVTDAGHGYPILLLHGFPDLWYSWRRQIPSLAEAGFRVITPDLRGFGGTDAPEEVESYVMAEFVEDIVGLFDALGIDKAAIVGHDLGGAVAWNFARTHAERCERIVSIGTPYLNAGSVVPTTAPTIALRDHFGLTDATFYMRHFQKPGVAEAELEQDPNETFRKIFRGAKHAEDLWTFATVGGGSSLLSKIGQGESLLSKIDLETYVRVYKRTGFRGAINYFRALDLTWEQEKEQTPETIDVPAMLIVPTQDKLLPTEFVEATTTNVPNLRVEPIDCAHFPQQEKPFEVTSLLMSFLGDLRQPDLE